MNNQPFMIWAFMPRDGVYFSLAIWTKTDALRILEAWRKHDLADARRSAAERRIFNGEWRWPDNRFHKDVKNISFKRMRKFWAAETRMFQAWSRAWDLCVKLDVPAFTQGELEHDVSVFFRELCEDIRSFLASTKSSFPTS